MFAQRTNQQVKGSLGCRGFAGKDPLTSGGGVVVIGIAEGFCSFSHQSDKFAGIAIDEGGCIGFIQPGETEAAVSWAMITLPCYDGNRWCLDPWFF